MKFSSNALPLFDGTTMCRFSDGPASTISRSASDSCAYGTSVRTPNSATTCGMTVSPNIFHAATAPCSIVRVGSGTSASSSMSRTTPVPSQRGQAPSELNANASAPGG